MTFKSNNPELAQANQKVVAEGEYLPEVQLKDGSRVQTGTVATMLVNIQRYNAGERGGVEQELQLAIPTLVKVGLFDLFQVDEWISGSNLGRHYVGLCAQAYFRDSEK